jgi:hypothetical protein
VAAAARGAGLRAAGGGVCGASTVTAGSIFSLLWAEASPADASKAA